MLRQYAIPTGNGNQAATITVSDSEIKSAIDKSLALSSQDYLVELHSQSQIPEPLRYNIDKIFQNVKELYFKLRNTANPMINSLKQVIDKEKQIDNKIDNILSSTSSEVFIKHHAVAVAEFEKLSGLINQTNAITYDLEPYDAVLLTRKKQMQDMENKLKQVEEQLNINTHPIFSQIISTTYSMIDTANELLDVYRRTRNLEKELNNNIYKQFAEINKQLEENRKAKAATVTQIVASGNVRIQVTPSKNRQSSDLQKENDSPSKDSKSQSEIELQISSSPVSPPVSGNVNTIESTRLNAWQLERSTSAAVPQRFLNQRAGRVVPNIHNQELVAQEQPAPVKGCCTIM